MKIEHKLVILGIITFLTVVAMVVGYNLYDANLRVAAYRECVKTNKEIAEIQQSSLVGLPTCYLR